MKPGPALSAILSTAIALPLAAEPSALGGRHPDCSPDGKMIAFSYETEGGWRLRAVTEDGADAALPAFGGDATEPDFSPDGQRIAFAWARDGHKDIAILDLHSGEVTALAENPADDRSPSWSPDAKQIVFCSDRDGNPDIYVVTIDGGGVVRLTTDPAADTSPAWSPDGKTIAFCSDRDGISQLYFMAPDGSDQRLALAAYATSPDWEPGERAHRIAYAGAPPDPNPMCPLPRTICLFDVGTGEVTRLLETARGSDPVWLPGLDAILFTIDECVYRYAYNEVGEFPFRGLTPGQPQRGAGH